MKTLLGIYYLVEMLLFKNNSDLNLFVVIRHINLWKCTGVDIYLYSSIEQGEWNSNREDEWRVQTDDQNNSHNFEGTAQPVF